MSHVVRHKTTGEYLLSENQWTSQLHHALHFNSGMNSSATSKKPANPAPPTPSKSTPITDTDLPMDTTHPKDRRA